MSKKILGTEGPLVKLQEWYESQSMSCEEIRDLIIRKYNLKISRAAIYQFIKKHFRLKRSHKESMKNRVVKGTMDYKKRTIDYINRKIDYKEIWAKRSPDYTGELKHPRTKQVSLPQPYVDKIRAYAKQNQKTLTDTLREILLPLGWKYDRFILREINQSFKPYTYDKKELLDLLDKLLDKG